eukprot:COSAG02_NODE_72999_length_178_cov_19.556962_1_plen_26_part_01
MQFGKWDFGFTILQGQSVKAREKFMS